MLDAIRGGIPHGFGDLPAVFARDGAEQPTELRPRAVLGFAPSEVGHEPTFHFGLPERPGLYRLEGYVRRGWTQLLPQFHGSFLMWEVWNHDNIRSTTVVLEPCRKNTFGFFVLSSTITLCFPTLEYAVCSRQVHRYFLRYT